MEQPRLLRIYLDDGLRQSAEAGQHNFISKIVKTVQQAGYRVEFRPNTATERAKSAVRRGYALFHMSDPTNERGMTFRRVYHYPFWAIVRSAQRWDWPVARATFAGDEVPQAEATRFYRFWQARLFGDIAKDAKRDGFVYVPLQGRLLDHRSFQACAPVEMLRSVLELETRPVVAALHPGEVYSDPEQRALERLAETHPGLTVVTGQMERLLAGCDYTVTQNSSAAFNGFFFGKPCAVFARIDFHHIAANVHEVGVGAALRSVPDMAPDYARYVHWFWQQNAINAGRPEAEDKIAAALAQAGWPI